MQIADMNVWAHQSSVCVCGHGAVLKFAEHILDPVAQRQRMVSWEIGILRFAFEELQAAIQRLSRAAGNQSAS